MKKIWALVLALVMLVSVLCLGTMSASAAVTGTFVDEIVAEFAVPEIVDFSSYGSPEIGTPGHRLAYEYNADLGATLMLKQDNDRDPSHTEYVTYKMAKNICGFELSVMCCAGLGNPLEDLTVFISKTGAEGSWAQVETQATKYVFDPNIYLSWHKAYWFNSTLMNAQKIPTGYKYLKIQFNPCTDAGDCPWNVAIDTVTITMGSNVAAPTIAEEDKFLTWEEINEQENNSTTEPTPTEPTTPSTEPSVEPTTPSTKPSVEPTTPSSKPSVEPTTPSTMPTTSTEPTTPTQPSAPGDYTPGDVNNDSKVNVRDLGMLQQSLNGWNVEIVKAAADVNGDDKVNVRDLGILQQFLNGWNVVLLPGGPSFGGATEPSDPEAPTDNTTTSTQSTTTSTQPTPPDDQGVVMPGAGYDLDGRDRIVVYASELITENRVAKASFTFKNISKDSGKEWVIPEYSQVTYACYDDNGVRLSTGTMVLGALEYNDTITCTITLPESTARIAFTGHNLEYWTPWA